MGGRRGEVVCERVGGLVTVNGRGVCEWEGWLGLRFTVMRRDVCVLVYVCVWRGLSARFMASIFAGNFQVSADITNTRARTYTLIHIPMHSTYSLIQPRSYSFSHKNRIHTHIKTTFTHT